MYRVVQDTVRDISTILRKQLFTGITTQQPGKTHRNIITSLIIIKHTNTKT